MIAKIIAAYTRHYRDNGHTGRTEGAVRPAKIGATMAEKYGVHMGALIARAICQGVNVEHQVW
jgi:hypothetical protein